MLSLFKKVTGMLQTEAMIIEDFINTHTPLLQTSAPRHHKVPHIPSHEAKNHKKVLTYHLTKDECNALKEHLLPKGSFVTGESEESWFGKILHEGQMIGIYLGKSYEYETFWARFWLEEEVSY